jgi:phospholipid/cholesterol/gamma-HCH transport system substrate-binding protein
MTKTLRDNARWIAAIFRLVVIAAVVAAYILDHQRVVWPWEEVYVIGAELSSAQAVTPGQGQQVLVARVPVGEVKRVRLRDGRALVELELRRGELDAVHADATVLLRPRTPLNDMAVALDPGSRSAAKLPPGAVLPVARTRPSVNPDEGLPPSTSTRAATSACWCRAWGAACRATAVACAASFARRAPRSRTSRWSTANWRRATGRSARW